MTPEVTNTKTDGNLGVSIATEKILAIIGPCEKGPLNTPSLQYNPDDVFTLHGTGPLHASSSCGIGTIQKPIVAIRSAASVAGAMGAVDVTGVTGTSAVSAGATAPFDDLDIWILVTVGGTRGVDGIKYKYSLNAGADWSAEQALGVATSIVVPKTNATFLLAAGTLVAGDLVKCTTTAPRSTTADLTAALAALFEYEGEWLRLLVAGSQADATIISQLDAFAKSFWPLGKNPEVICSTRPRDATGETRAQYLTAMAAIFGAVQSLDVCVCVDQCELLIASAGGRLRRPTAWPVAARLMSIDDSEDGMAVALGALPGVFLSTSAKANNYHDEAIHGGMDALGATALRRFWGKPKRPGAYINNVRLPSGPTSDYQYFDLSAIVNRVIEDCHNLLEPRLGIGVTTTDQGTITDDSAKTVEDVVNAELRARYVDSRRCTDLKMGLVRTSPIATNGGLQEFIVQVKPLTHIKKFIGKTGLVKAITI